MASRTIFLRTTMMLVLLVLIVGAVPQIRAGELMFGDACRSKLGPARVSITQTVLQEEPEIFVTADGAFESHIDAPDGRKYSYLSIPGCGVTAQDIGYPEMPFKGFLLEIPYGVDVSVELVDYSVISLGAGFLIYPKQRPLRDSATSEHPFEINKEVYATDALVPALPVAIDEPGFIRGRRVVFVQVSQLQYNPLTTEVWAFWSLRFRLKFTGTPDKTGEARKRQLATRTSETFAEDLITNYEPIAAEEPGEGEGGVGMLSSGDGGADYLIIVADNLYEEILPLAEWKHKKGFITYVANMNEVGNTDDDVKNYIQNAYDTWNPAPFYVLLVGDQSDVPGYDIVGHPRHGPNHHWPSDHPYACVDGSDYYPDLSVGRLSVHTEAEATTVVNKILAYDRTPDDGDWYDDFLAAAYFQDFGDDGTADRWFMETAMTVYDFLVNDISVFTGHIALCTTHWPLTYEQYHFHSSSYPHRADLNQIRWGESPYPDPVPSWIVNFWTSALQATSDITTVINGGVGIVQHRDHGAYTGWGHPPYHVSHVNNLSNAEKTPVVVSMNCLTGGFDYSGGDCFAEALQKHSNGGAVGVLAATRVSYSGYNDLITHGIYTCFWPSYDPDHTDSTYSHSWRPSEALAYGKYYMRIYKGTGSYTELEFKLFHWFGDPEMMLRTQTPNALSVSHISIVEPDMPGDFTVTVTKDSNSLEGAFVAITHPSIEQDYWTGFTDANGLITFSDILFSKDDPNNPNNYDIVVSAHNCIPYEGTIFLYESEGFCIKDSSGEIVAWFDDFGNLVLKGSLTQNTPPQATDNDEFRVQDSAGNDVAIIDATNGDMEIYGSVQDWTAPDDEKDEFIIYNDADPPNPVAYIDELGNLYLKGEFYGQEP